MTRVHMWLLRALLLCAAACVHGAPSVHRRALFGPDLKLLPPGPTLPTATPTTPAPTAPTPKPTPLADHSGPCASNPCLHGGTCKLWFYDSGLFSYKCFCQDGYTGLTCLEDHVNPTTSPTTKRPTHVPTHLPTSSPTMVPTTRNPSISPTRFPTKEPTMLPTRLPTKYPTTIPTNVPTPYPTRFPTKEPTMLPTRLPTKYPTAIPTNVPTPYPTKFPTKLPTRYPSYVPTLRPTFNPTYAPSALPTTMPTLAPTKTPTRWWAVPAEVQAALAQCPGTLQHATPTCDPAYWKQTTVMVAPTGPGTDPSANPNCTMHFGHSALKHKEKTKAQKQDGTNRDMALLNALLSSEGEGALNEISVLYASFNLTVSVESLDTLCGIMLQEYARSVQRNGQDQATICGHVLPRWKGNNVLPVGQVVQCKSTQPAKVLDGILEACVMPCMDDVKQACCFVPATLTRMFACCAPCCPDTSRTAAAESRRQAQRADTAAAVVHSVAQSKASMSTFRLLLSCLKREPLVRTCTSRLAKPFGR